MALRNSPHEQNLSSLNATTDEVSGTRFAVITVNEAVASFVGTVQPQMLDAFGTWITLSDKELTAEGAVVVDTGLPTAVRAKMVAYTSGTARITIRTR